MDSHRLGRHRLALGVGLIAVTAIALLSTQWTEMALAADSLKIGTVGRIKKMADDHKSFTVSAKGLPSRVRVTVPDDVKVFEVTTEPFTAVKDGEAIHVLGIRSEGNEQVGPSIAGIRALALGDFTPPSELPEKMKKVKGLEWISGSLSRKDKKVTLDGATITVGGTRLIAKFKKSSSKALQDKKQIHLFGTFTKKAKGEKEHHFAASDISILDKKVPASEYASLFFMGKKKDISF